MITLEQIKEEKIRIAKENNIPIDESELNQSCYDEYCKRNNIQPEITEYKDEKKIKKDIQKLFFNIFQEK